MAVYVFNLIAGFILNGVDSAQGYRAKLLKGVPFPVKYVFVETPTQSDIMWHEKNGIRREQMVDIHQFFTDNHTMKRNGNVQNKAEELLRKLQCTRMERRDGKISLIRQDESIAADILLDAENQNSFHEVLYYKYGKLIRREAYTDGLAYMDYYMTAKSETGLYAKTVRRTFCNQDGTVVYDQIYKDGQEWNLFPDGRRYSKQQLFAEFIRKLDLGARDSIILDRPARRDLLQPIFQFKKDAKLIFVEHARHYYEKGENPYQIRFNSECNYCVKYSKFIDTIVVSTEEQKEDLKKNLRDYGQNIPEIAVISAGGISCLRYPEQKRRPYSLISVSRIAARKKIDWIIKSVIKANRMNDKISIDIFGPDDGYLSYMQGLIAQNQAQSYIRLKGWADVTELYKDYEVYLSASLEETLGLSLLEATASGTAMIGLDVKYGNRLFIRSEENGYLISSDTGYSEDDAEKITDAMAEKIVEIFQDEGRLERFHQKSYEIADKFDEEIIEKKWKNLLGIQSVY